MQWLPNWRCPGDSYFLASAPVRLVPEQITGRPKLLTMFGSYTEVGPDAARRVMAAVPVGLRDAAWEKINGLIEDGISDSDADVADVKRASDLSETTKRLLVDARRGQGKFRTEVIERWQGRCAVCGCTQSEVLRASHIKPWKISTNRERLDPRNGLALSANLDALFDQGLISFERNGAMIVSRRVSPRARELLGIPSKLKRAPDLEEAAYLAFHRQERFQP